MGRTDSMTISTTRINPGRRTSWRCCLRQPANSVAGFTLVELQIGAVLGTMVLAGVVSSFLMLGRTSIGAVNYSVAESELRRGIEEFSRDVRMAKTIRWN